jgi:serine/threonine protein kinase
MIALAVLNAALAPRHALERVVGEGGMATVYLARDLRHNRRVLRRSCRLPMIVRLRPGTVVP